jgi:hypothetical protein
MKTAKYKLAGEIAAERGLADVFGPADDKGKKTLLREGVVIETPEAESTSEFLTLMEDGKEEHMLRLAQGQLDIIRQRKIREAAEDEVTADILAGKKVKADVDMGDYGTEGEEIDFSTLDDDQRRDAVRVRCQAIGNAYTYGSRAPSTGGSKVVKEKAAKQTKLQTTAAAGQLTDENVQQLLEIGVLSEADVPAEQLARVKGA